MNAASGLVGWHSRGPETASPQGPRRRRPPKPRGVSGRKGNAVVVVIDRATVLVTRPTLKAGKLALNPLAGDHASGNRAGQPNEATRQRRPADFGYLRLGSRQ